MRRAIRHGTVLLLLALTAAFAVAAPGAPGGSAAECAAMADDAKRLAGCDAEAGRRPEGPDGDSFLSWIWELSPSTRRRTFSLTPYRANYLLPFTWNASPNEEAVRAADPGGRVLREEVQFQLSVKVKLGENLLGRNLDLWAAYTQLSFWQFYDFDGSAPFRETNFEPEILLDLRTDYRILGLRGRILALSLDHQSNGRGEPLSRSWNRVVGNAAFERGPVVLWLRAWYRIPEAARDDDNPGIERYLGYGEAQLSWFRMGTRLGLLWRNNLRSRGNRGAVRLTASFPLLRRVSGYLLFFNGYGESLLDYNAHSNRFGAGFILREW
ncbi:MAG: hypothetical protein Kow00128_01030 [Deltaproteobacteria bacterium]